MKSYRRETMFKLEIRKLNWIKDDGADDPNDLCAHGIVCVTIGDRQLKEAKLCMSAGAIFLLRSLTDDHIEQSTADPDAVRILPCCGNGLFEDENDPNRVFIVTCPFGVDFSVIHDGGNVKIISDFCGEAVISINEYRREVYTFADEVEKFYNESAPKAAHDQYTQKGYEAMWREWKKLRYS